MKVLELACYRKKPCIPDLPKVSESFAPSLLGSEIRANIPGSRRLPPVSLSLGTSAEIAAGLCQCLERLGFGSVFGSYLNLNAFMRFCDLAFKLLADRLPIFSETIKHHTQLLSILLFDNNRTVNSKKTLLQKNLDHLNRFVIYSTAIDLSFSFTSNKAGSLQLLKVMRDSRARKIHAATYFCKSFL